MQPGETLQFGKALPLSKYFPAEWEYQIAWEGKIFQKSYKDNQDNREKPMNGNAAYQLAGLAKSLTMS